MNELISRAEKFIENVGVLRTENRAAIKSRENFQNKIQEIINTNAMLREDYSIASQAIVLLRSVSDEVVTATYREIEDSINSALERMFVNTKRTIKIEESVRAGQYPQLSLVLVLDGGVRRSIKNDSGHGIAQIISFLVLLCLIVKTNSRKILCLDEVLTGVSEDNLKVISDIMWAFTQIGFQFIVNQHGFVPRGAQVYELQNIGGVSRIANSYIAERGVYFSSVDDADFGEEEEEDSFDEQTEYMATASEQDSTTGIISL